MADAVATWMHATPGVDAPPVLPRQTWQVLAFAGEGRTLAERLKASGPGAPGTPLPAGLQLLAAFQKVCCCAQGRMRI